MTITTLFTHKRSQAVRLPAEARFEPKVKHVEVRVRGHERIIVPVAHRWDSFFATTASMRDDLQPERATQLQPERDDL